jgi:hypothetical protein
MPVFRREPAMSLVPFAVQTGQRRSRRRANIPDCATLSFDGRSSASCSVTTAPFLIALKGILSRSP